jgi:hypothetical protein
MIGLLLLPRILGFETNRVPTVFSPFIDRFSPFSTAVPACRSPESSGASSACSRAPGFAPSENGEIGENGNATL